MSPDLLSVCPLFTSSSLSTPFPMVSGFDTRAPTPTFPHVAISATCPSAGGITSRPSLKPMRDFHCLWDKLQTPPPGLRPLCGLRAACLSCLSPASLPHHTPNPGLQPLTSLSRGLPHACGQWFPLPEMPLRAHSRLSVCAALQKGLSWPLRAALSPLSSAARAHAPWWPLATGAVSCLPVCRGCLWGFVCPAPLSSWGGARFPDIPISSGVCLAECLSLSLALGWVCRLGLAHHRGVAVSTRSVREPPPPRYIHASATWLRGFSHHMNPLGLAVCL